MSEFYHLTTADRVSSIERNGLALSYGHNSAGVFDLHEPCIFLAKQKDIPYWRVLLGTDMLVEISDEWTKNKRFKKNHYFFYNEYVCTDFIPPLYLKIKKLTDPVPVNYQKQIVKRAFTGLQTAVAHCVNIHLREENPIENEFQEHKNEIDAFLYGTRNLDYNVRKPVEYKLQLERHSDEGYITMTDVTSTYPAPYKDKRAWELLKLYPDSPAKESELKLYDYIKANFGEDILFTDTGEWDV